MSSPRGFGLNGKSYYTNVAKPSDVNLAFTVDASNGLGVTSVKSNGYVRNVFMHTGVAPTSNDGYLNPNPANGFCWVQFTNNFNHFLGGFFQLVPVVSGSIKMDNSALTPGVAYVISTLGDATAAQWAAVGVPPGVTPAVGVSFIALTDGGAANVSTSRVSTATSSGVFQVEVVGVPDTSISNSNVGSNGGAWVMLQFRDAAGALVAPPDGTVVSGVLKFDASSVTVDGL